MPDAGTHGAGTSVILVGVEGRLPDAVLAVAARLAHDLRCDLVCAHVDPGRYAVSEGADGSVRSMPLDPDLPDTDDEGFEPGMAARIDATLAHTGVRWSSRELAGEPAHALGHLADTLDARMIVIGTHRPGIGTSVRDLFRASVAIHLAHRQHRPVLVVPLAPVGYGGPLPWE